jgi:hypothetical protein
VAQERVEFLFAAQVEGQQQMQKLIASVDSLRAETEKLKGANAGLASSTETVIRNGTRYNNVADAQSKQLRQQRQGTQQLGMQFNDLATSISTGASPIQAFNQQLGQVGFAMSQMGGAAGKVGAFLAGPWGAAILVATMVLTPFIESLFDVSEATKEAEEAAKKMDSAVEARMQSEYNLRLALADTAKEYRQIRLEMMANAAQAVKTASVELNARLKVLNALQAEQEALEEKAAGAGGLRAQAEMTTGQVLDRARVGGGIKNSITAVKAQITALEGATAKLNAATIDVAQAQRKVDKGTSEPKNKTVSEIEKLRAAQQKVIDEFEAGKLTYADFETQLTAVTDAYKEARNPAEEFLSKFKEADQAAKKFDDAAVNLANKSLPDWLIALRSINAEYKFLADNNRETTKRMSDLGQMATATAAGPLEAMLEKYEKMNTGLSPIQEDMAALAHIMNILSEEGSAAGVNLEYIAMLYKRIREEMDKAEVTKKNAEIKSSFESIGNAVSDAFKGMLTGATSFKDGMKSIINSVIDELWKLYVVKQIVGFFTDTVMPALKIPKFANGTMNAPGGLALVGERGPELVNLPKGSQVIPNHKMKGGIGGGINITVDARGSSDPAAVRAQVQQGILEAAPAIIAAAEARTTRGLRRPRLAGVMQ